MMLLEVLERIKSGELTDFDVHSYIDEKAGADPKKLKLLQRHVEIYIIKTDQSLGVTIPVEKFENCIKEIYDSYLHKEKVKPALEQVMNQGLSGSQISLLASSDSLKMRYSLLDPSNSKPDVWADILISGYEQKLFYEGYDQTSDEAFEMLLILAIDQCTKRYGASFLFDLISVILLRQAAKIIEEKIEAVDSVNKDKEGLSKSNNDKLSVASNWMDPLVKKIASLDVPQHENVIKIFNEEYPGFELKFDFKKLSTPVFAKGTLIKTSIGEALKFIFQIRHPKETITGDAIIRRYNRKGCW